MNLRPVRETSNWSAWVDYLLWAISYCNLDSALGSPWASRLYGPPPKAPPFPHPRRWGGPWGGALAPVGRSIRAEAR